MGRSRILANLMDSEFRELVAAVHPSEPLIHGVIRDYLRELLELEMLAGRVRSDLDLELGADYLTRMILSWMSSPGGVDVSDDAEVREVVRREFLAGMATPIATDDPG